MSDNAVQAKTGKTWPEWFATLDAVGAQTMSHQAIMAYLRREHHLSGWWQQNVTVAYEQARGLRAKHQMQDDFQISVSKTIAASAARIFAAWQNDDLRAQWLSAPGLRIRTATPAKSLRAVWVDGQSRVDVELYPNADPKVLLTIRHRQLPDADHAASMKAYCAQALQQLKALLAA